MSSNLKSDTEDRILEILKDIKHTGEKISVTLDSQTRQLTDIKEDVDHTNDTIVRSNKTITRIEKSDSQIPIVMGSSAVAGSLLGSFFGPIGSLVGVCVGLTIASIGYIIKK